MGYWDDFKGWLGDPMRSGGQYEGVDRENFNLPGAQARGENADRVAADALNRGAPQAANDSSFRADQQSVVERLRRVMSGQESQSALQLQQANDSSNRYQRSMAASARPQNAAMAQRLAGQNAARSTQGLALNQAMAGIQERNAATGALGQIAGQGRGQDMQNAQFNVGAELQNRGMNDAMWGQAQGIGLQNAGMQQQGGMNYEQNRTNRYGAMLGTPANWEGLVSAGSGIAGAAAMFSDERVKTDVKDGGAEADSFLDSVDAITFNYDGEYPSDQVPMLEDYHKIQGIRDQQMGVERPAGNAPAKPRPQSLTERSVSAIDKQTPPSNVVLSKDPPRSDEGLIDRYPYVKLERTQPLGPAIDKSIQRNTPAVPPRQSLRESGAVPVLGVSAQKVESTPMGAQGVVPTAGGIKTIQPQRLTGALLAGLGRLNQRLKEVEAPNKGKRIPTGRIGRQ